MDDGRLLLVAGAEREWTPRPDAPIAVSPCAWVRGSAPVADGAGLAARLAARVVAVRRRPRVLVGRPAAQAAALVDALERAGVEAVNVPAIDIRPEPAGGELDRVLAGTTAGTWVVVASANAATGRDRRGAADGDRPARAPLGRRRDRDGRRAPRRRGSTASSSRRSRTARPSDGSCPSTAGEPVLLPRADIADPALAATLRARGADVTEVVAYRTLEAPDASRPLLAAALDDGPVDALVLTSGSTARGLLALAADEPATDALLATPAIAIGRTTLEVAGALGFATVLAAPSPDAVTLAAFVATALGLGPAAGETTPTQAPVPAATGGSR